LRDQGQVLYSPYASTSDILAVNPRILADSGGPCVPDPPEDGGIFGPNYTACLNTIKKEFVTSTALGSMVGCLLMGLLANLPVAVAPGMGMNAYFTYSVVGWRGTGNISYESAVTAVMIEGAIFLVLAVSGARYAIIKLIPEPVKIATPAGIGAFLAHLGLQTAEGLGVVVSDIATAVTLGACPYEHRTPIVAFTAACMADTTMCVTSDAYTCDNLGGIMTSATTWIGILGLMIMAVMMGYKQNWALIAGIGFVTAVSWFRGTAVTYFPDTSEGDARFDYFRKVVSIEPLNTVLTPFTNDLQNVGVALFTFLYVDFLDTSGTLLAIASSMGITDEQGNFPGSRAAFSVDAISTMIGSLFGLSPVTAFIESGAGVQVGSRTGLTAVFCAFFFFLSIFFAPIISSIPPWATGGALIIVGALMCRVLQTIKWYDPTHAITAFLTVIVMPLTYSIAYGLLAGIGSYVIMHGTFYILSFVGIPYPVFEKTDDMYISGVKGDEKIVEDSQETSHEVSDPVEKPIDMDKSKTDV